MMISFCAGSLESFLFMNTQECNAGMMADGYTRTTGKMLLVLTQLGGTEKHLHSPAWTLLQVFPDHPEVDDDCTKWTWYYQLCHSRENGILESYSTAIGYSAGSLVWHSGAASRFFCFFFQFFLEFWFPDHEVHDFLCWISWHGQIYLHCQAANKTIGQGGFQEVEQMAMFKDSVCYQEEAPFLKWMLLAAFWTEHFMAEHGKIGNSLVPFWRKSCWCLQVRDHTRICEVLNRVIEKVRASIWSICVL